MKIFTQLLFIVTMWTTQSIATIHEVLVSSNVFTPSSLEIEAVDTVRWINTGGNHNVFETNGKFRCALGCEAEGGDGNPSSESWISEVTFRNLGTIVYICQPHIGFGMQGSISVVKPTSTNVYSIEATAKNTFQPDDISILRGDVIQFTNQGGVHNINFDDNALVCSEGCAGDGTNTDSEPTGFPWDIFIKFDQIDEIPYFCAKHQNTGLLRVLSDNFFANGFE